ncbi:hypothetical protein GCM10022209_27650 [Chitinophaga oryziterrae]
MNVDIFCALPTLPRFVKSGVPYKLPEQKFQKYVDAPTEVFCIVTGLFTHTVSGAVKLAWAYVLVIKKVRYMKMLSKNLFIV